MISLEILSWCLQKSSEDFFPYPRMKYKTLHEGIDRSWYNTKVMSLYVLFTDPKITTDQVPWDEPWWIPSYDDYLYYKSWRVFVCVMSPNFCTFTCSSIQWWMTCRSWKDNSSSPHHREGISGWVIIRRYPLKPWLTLQTWQGFACVKVTRLRSCWDFSQKVLSS